MSIHGTLGTKDVALTTCFAALYAALSFVPMFRLSGASQFITAAAVMVPLIGLMLGAYLGALAALLGGIISLFLNPGLFSLYSLAAGVAGAMCAGFLKTGRRTLCALVYAALLLIFAVYPRVGPLWSLPQYTWFQIAGLIILVSPLQSAASKRFRSPRASGLFFAFFLTSLTSTLAGLLAGNIAFETLSSVTILDPAAFWFVLMWLYPFERILIALISALVGVPLFEILKTTKLIDIPYR